MDVPKIKRWQLWTPEHLPTLAWYDAKDGTYITESGGLVSQWNDRSGNNRHIAQSNNIAKPVFDSNSVSFDGVNQYLFNTSPFMHANGNLTVFFAGSVNPVATERRLLSEGSSADDTPVYGFQNSNIDASRMMFFIRNDDGEFVFMVRRTVSSAGAFDNARRLYVWSDTGDQAIGNIDGGPMVVATYERPSPLTLDRFSMGAALRTGVSNRLECIVNEIVITKVLTSFAGNNLQAIMEGYLAWRWGLQDQLYEEHRYKLAPPLIPA